MSEDYTYPTTPTLADLRKRVQELERENAELRERQSAQFERSTARLVDVALDAERQAQRVAELERQLAQADSNMVALAARNAELARENTELRQERAAALGALNLVPEYIQYLSKWRAGDGSFLLFNEYVAKRVQAVQP